MKKRKREAKVYDYASKIRYITDINNDDQSSI